MCLLLLVGCFCDLWDIFFSEWALNKIWEPSIEIWGELWFQQHRFGFSKESSSVEVKGSRDIPRYLDQMRSRSDFKSVSDHSFKIWSHALHWPFVESHLRIVSVYLVWHSWSAHIAFEPLKQSQWSVKLSEFSNITSKASGQWKRESCRESTSMFVWFVAENLVDWV